MAIFSVTDLDADLATCAAANGGVCEDDTLLWIKRLRDAAPSGGEEGEIDIGTGEVPVIVGGGAEELGITAGPKFNYGRTSWIDVVPD